MSHTIRTYVAAATAVVALGAVGSALSAPPPKVVGGGPGFTIDLKTEQKKPTKPTTRIFRITNVRANAAGLGAL
jgi:hypothetical protein